MKGKRNTDGSAERLRRLLLIIPYASRPDGAPVDELARTLGLAPRELYKESNFLMNIGPSGAVEDLIELELKNKRIFVRASHKFDKPPPLTAAEGAALAAAAGLWSEVGGPTLVGARRKLAATLPERARVSAERLAGMVDADLASPRAFAALKAAIEQREEVDIEYLRVAARRELPRRVRPALLVSHDGHWYLSAHSVTDGGGRLFRVDWIGKVSPTGVHFKATEGPELTSPTATLGEPVATVRFTPEGAPYAREQFGAEVRELSGRRVEVDLRNRSADWIVRWVLAFGGTAEVVAPRELRDAVARAARAAAEGG
jgi:proteasome accessory factor C